MYIHFLLNDETTKKFGFNIFSLKELFILNVSLTKCVFRKQFCILVLRLKFEKKSLYIYLHFKNALFKQLYMLKM